MGVKVFVKKMNLNPKIIYSFGNKMLVVMLGVSQPTVDRL